MGRPKDTRTLSEKFHQSYRKDESGCWLWKKPDSQGYGNFYHDGVRDRAHRISYQLHHGKIPDGALIRHDCDTPLCVNPEHLRPGSSAENAADAVARRRTLTGERNYFAKLTGVEVEQIRRQLSEGVTKVEVARRFSVSRKTVYLIATGKIWRNDG